MGKGEIPFDKAAACEECGTTGAFDFMGHFLCSNCGFPDLTNLSHLQALETVNAALRQQLAAAKRDVLRQGKIPAWIVWSTNKAGMVTMEGIALHQDRAVEYKHTLEASNRDYVLVKIEKTEVNHLLAVDMDDLWQQLYGGVEAAQDRTMQQREQVAREGVRAANASENQAWQAVEAAKLRITELEDEAAASQAREQAFLKYSIEHDWMCATMHHLMNECDCGLGDLLMEADTHVALDTAIQKHTKTLETSMRRAQREASEAEAEAVALRGAVRWVKFSNSQEECPICGAWRVVGDETAPHNSECLLTIQLRHAALDAALAPLTDAEALLDSLGDIAKGGTLAERIKSVIAYYSSQMGRWAAEGRSRDKRV